MVQEYLVKEIINDLKPFYLRDKGDDNQTFISQIYLSVERGFYNRAKELSIRWINTVSKSEKEKENNKIFIKILNKILLLED